MNSRGLFSSSFARALGGGTLGSKLLVYVNGSQDQEGLIRLASLLAGSPGGQLQILSVIQVAGDQPLSEGALEVQQRRMRLEQSSRRSTSIPAHVLVRVARTVWPEIIRAAGEIKPDLLVIGLPGQSVPSAFYEAGISSLLADPPCNIALIAQPQAEVRRILLPLRGGPNAELAIELTRHLAVGLSADLTALHVLDEAGRGSPGDMTRLEKMLIREGRRHQLMVMGAPGPHAGGAGRIDPLNIARQAGCGLIMVRTRQPLAAWPAETLPSGSTPLVEKWFAENTYHAEEFADLSRLIDWKRQQGLTVSLGLPALNEGETIGEVIRTFRDVLLRDTPLLDEIVLIDSGSTDGTVEIARGLDVPVYRHQDILPGCGALCGKGEALWKSLHVLHGDLVVWVDTDLRNPDPAFVYGLVGPLLAQPRLNYVKGYYARPLRVGDGFDETGGGRVTELTARPLLNLFFPELAGFIQPLAGQNAGRRAALERVPFFSGFGVETGLLIDLVEACGLPAVAQVNLGTVIHRNKPLKSLSTMSFNIMQAIVKRLEARGTLQSAEGFNKTMKLVGAGQDRLGLDDHEADEAERPPIVSVPAYRLDSAASTRAGSRNSEAPTEARARRSRESR